MLTRRKLLAASALTGAAILTRSAPPLRAAAFETPLPVPQLIDAAANGNRVALTIGQGRHAYWPGHPVAAHGYSAPVLGPVIRLQRGQSTEFTVENRMQRPTTVHWHGLVIPSEVDGGPHNDVRPGGTWKPTLHIDQPETTAWFHPHPHGETAPQVYSGLAGLIIVEDGTGARLGLPRDYGVDDLPLILQDRWFDRSGAPVYRPGPMEIMMGYRGDTLVTNGVVAPVASVPASLVRLRLLNGANARFFDLRFSDGRTFHVIASDGGYLAAPVAMRALTVAPGERYEILVDFTGGRDVVLTTGPDENTPMMGMMGGSPPLSSAAIVKFVVDRSKPAAVTSIPSALVDVPALDRSKVAARRQFVLNDMMMGGMMGGMGFRGGAGPAMAINGRPFDMERIDVATRLGTMELWEIGSQMMAHPFHVHGTQFQILSLNGRTPPTHLRGWKDTVVVAREAQILVPLTQPGSRERPFMYHCHILEHEDAGMMGQYVCA
jgi:FtsP/CotA-like multicopper oxidase with cupredoxin domain